MRYLLLAGLCLGAAVVSGAAEAQQGPAITQTIAGTRLDITATGEVTRVPDVAVISAGVVTSSATATGALQEAADRMARVGAALRSAGIADRDIQTSSVNLNPEYRYDNDQPPQLTGYTASNQVSIRFRDIRNAGRILDALVKQGANQINGPNLTIDKPEAALDEARAKAIASGRARADLYARSLGMRDFSAGYARIGGAPRSNRPCTIQPAVALTKPTKSRRQLVQSESACGRNARTSQRGWASRFCTMCGPSTRNASP